MRICLVFKYHKTSTILKEDSCIAIYAYSCLKPLSNRPEAVFKQQNPCSNYEIRVLFEHSLKMRITGRAFFRNVTLLYIAALFNDLLKKCQRQHVML